MERTAAKPWRTFAACVGLLTCLRIAALVVTPLDLHGDEAQYWLWSRTLDWGYFSKPPLIAWAIAATTALFGNGEWAVRLASPLAHAGGSFALFALGNRMAGPPAGFWAGLGWLLLPGVSLSSALISTDALLLPIWACALYCAWRLLETPGWRWALALGLAIGVGMLAKYAMGYFALGLAIAAFATPRMRGVLSGRNGIIVAAAALVVLAPNLVWNAANGFATISHTAANAAWSGSRFDLAPALLFVIDQFGVAGPIFVPLLVYAAWRTLRDPALRDERRLFLLAFAAPPLVLIFVQALISRAHGNWAATGYPAAITLVALHFSSARPPRILSAAAAFHSLFAALFLAAMTNAPFADALGLGNALKRVRMWDETAAIVRARAQAGAPEGPFTALMVDNRLVFNDLSYYLTSPAPPAPLRMWVMYAQPTNQAERRAPMRTEEGARVLIVGATPTYEPWIAADFRRVGPLETVEIPLGGGRTRRLTFRVGHEFAPIPRTPAYEMRLKRRED